jgi:hypothetical protein
LKIYEVQAPHSKPSRNGRIPHPGSQNADNLNYLSVYCEPRSVVGRVVVVFFFSRDNPGRQLNTKCAGWKVAQQKDTIFRGLAKYEEELM